MIEKMSIEQFRDIRSQLQKILDDYDAYYDEHKDDPDADEKTDQYEKKSVEKYCVIQSILYNYDLSDIPFEEWSDFYILSDENHIADFSKTKANMDFDLVECEGFANFKSCNIKNLEKHPRVINSKYFDEEIIKMYPSLFLSESFSDEFKERFYDKNLTIQDLVKLTESQLEELTKQDLFSHMNHKKNDSLIIRNLGLDKSIELYNYSIQDYEIIKQILDNFSFDFGFKTNTYDSIAPSNDTIFDILNNSSVTDMKKNCFEFMKQRAINSIYELKPEKFPDSFKNENPELFLIGADIPDEIKEKYFKRNLSIHDLLQYMETFSKIPIEGFMSYKKAIPLYIRDNYGVGKFQELIQNHREIFEIIEDDALLENFFKYMPDRKDLEKSFSMALKSFLVKHDYISNFREDVDGRTVYNIPNWLSSMNYKIIDRLKTMDELFNYNDSMIVLDNNQRNLIDNFGIDNIIKLEQEIGFFSHDSNDLYGFDRFAQAFESSSKYYVGNEFHFKSGRLSYNEFLNQFANLLDFMRRSNVFSNIPSYDWIQGEFRNKHKEIFMDLNAPEELRKAFYRNNITPPILHNHDDYIQYLIDKDLTVNIKAHMKLVNYYINDEGNVRRNEQNFIYEYASRYGNEKLLKLISKYGPVLLEISITNNNNEIDDEIEIEKSLRKAIHNLVLQKNFNYSYLSSIPEMMEEYPEMFINLDSLDGIFLGERARLTKAFYEKRLSYDDVKKYPELITILKDKDLSIAFGYKVANSDLEIAAVFGKEKFLELCSKYGRYLENIVDFLAIYDVTINNNGKFVQDKDGNLIELSISDLSSLIEDIIAKECILGNIPYQEEDAPEFLKKNHPELFLDEDTPLYLKQFFYNYNNNYPLTFEMLSKNKNWLDHLKGKSIKTALLRNTYLRQDMLIFLEMFGEEKAIQLGINKAETVNAMMRAHQVGIMKMWYDKTGGKFIPDFVVMQNFRIDEADKFLSSATNWSNLMRIQSFARTPEARDAMLKLAYSFGVFDNDQRGFKKLQDLLTSLPKKIDADKGYIIDRIDEHIEMYTEKDFFFTEDRTDKQYSFEEMLNYVKYNSKATMFLGSDILISDFLETLQNEKVDIDFSKSIFKQLYKKNDDGTYSLTINQQTCPKTAKIVRTILGNFRELPILTPDKAHQLFGGFELKYDADFREFLLANMDKIMENPEYVSLVASVQKQFSDIKAINSNRALTWELAVSYVQSNKYTSVNIGNERVAEVSAIAGYSQRDFDTLQQIYNYGKQRTFSSIPRIKQSAEKTSGRYTYETLRLDDPLAMAIGTLTDCCQELNNCAEVCMEHSMVDKNGRVFVIKDEQGNLVAQSWVWRNKDVLCFDNIEIPGKAFARAVKEHPELGRKGFTDEIYELYKQAAQDLIEADEKVYKELLESGKITKEQYDGLRLGKVTVGLGYNDIAESLKQNSKVDRGTVSRPLPFEEPVKLSRGLYTSDSTTQYIIEERDDRKEYNGETLPVHSDTLIEYSNENFNDKALLSLEKLELATNGDRRYLNTSVNVEDSKHLVSAIANNYSLNPETARIIMNPNFAIIYDVNGNVLKIGDLFFNTTVDNGMQQMDIEKQVIMQMRVAFDQIAKDKEIDISDLYGKQREMYAKITRLTDEIDIERGVGHAR